VVHGCAVSRMHGPCLCHRSLFHFWACMWVNGLHGELDCLLIGPPLARVGEPMWRTHGVQMAKSIVSCRIWIFPRPRWRPDKPLRDPPSISGTCPCPPSTRVSGESERAHEQHTRPPARSHSPPAGRPANPSNGARHRDGSLPLSHRLSPPLLLSRSSARFLRLLFRISRGSGSPSSGARRSRSRTGRQPTAASRRGPPIWPSTSSSSSRSVCLTLPPFDRWNACMQVFSAGPVPLTPHRAFSVSGQTARAARPGDSRWEC
jgi:hypothetical protein